MANVTSYSQLLIELQKVRDKALEGTGEKAKELVKDRIDKDVYDVYSPTDYIRTNDLRESVQPSKVKSNGNVAEVTIGHDINLIRSTGNQHRSIADDSSSVDSIAEIVHNGKVGAIYQSGYWRDAPWYDDSDAFANSRPYMDNAKEEMENGKYRDFMVEELEKQGIKVK